MNIFEMNTKLIIEWHANPVWRKFPWETIKSIAHASLDFQEVTRRLKNMEKTNEKI